MTSTNRDWSADDPYAGQDLPEPPAWLPEAGDAVRAAQGREAVAEPSPGARLDLEKRPEAAPAAPADDPVDQGAGEPGGEIPAPPPAAGAPPEAAAEQAAGDAEGDEAWAFVPLGISDAETADVGPPLGAGPASAAGLVAADEEPGYVYDDLTSATEPDPAGFPYEPGLPGQHHFDDDRRGRPWALIALAGSLVVFIVVIVVIFMSGGDAEKKNPQAKPPSGPSLAPQAMPSTPVGARPVAADLLPSLQPQAVTVGTFDGELQVNWDPPQKPEAVSGYFVVTQTVDGQVDERVLIEKNSELTAVFDDTDMCVVVTTVVGTPDGLQLARGDLVCPTAPSPTKSQSRR